MNIKDLWTDNVKLILIAVVAAFLISGILTYKAEAQEQVVPTCELSEEVMSATMKRGYHLADELSQTDEVAEKVAISVQLKALEKLYNNARNWYKQNCEPV